MGNLTSKSQQQRTCCIFPKTVNKPIHLSKTKSANQQSTNWIISTPVNNKVTKNIVEQEEKFGHVRYKKDNSLIVDYMVSEELFGIQDLTMQAGSKTLNSMVTASLYFQMEMHNKVYGEIMSSLNKKRMLNSNGIHKLHNLLK